MAKIALTTILAAGALVLGATPAAVGASAATHARLAGIVPHSSSAAVLHGSARTSSKATAFTCAGAPCTGYESAINQFFTDVAHDSGTSNNVYSVATQFSDHTGSIAYDSTFGGSYVDTTPFPASTCDDAAGNAQDTVCLTDAQLQAEILHAISVNGWQEDNTAPSHLYFIFTPSNVGICSDGGPASSLNQCSTNAFCAYHDNFGDPTTNANLAYAVEPEDGTIPSGGCDDGNSPNGTGADATINTVSHEMNEAITDPWPESSPGWWSNDGEEDEEADLCSWTFGTPLGNTLSGEYNQVINGHDYWLQQEYSNAGSGCMQHLGGTTSATSTGVGPLVFQGGSVMRTNTVYAIYWVPTTTAQIPAVTAPPVISGVDAVGKTLSATKGTWTGSPASYAYEWLRCSASGATCSAVTGANGATYKLAKADAGHDLEVQVSATNAAATVSSTSAATDAVVDVPHVKHKPLIKGSAKVGKKLSVAKGPWTNSPTRFSYQWLRCTAKGSSCKAITGAKRATYTLTARDAAHRLRVRVTAVNVAGSAKSTSGSSGVVKP